MRRIKEIEEKEEGCSAFVFKGEVVLMNVFWAVIEAQNIFTSKKISCFIVLGFSRAAVCGCKSVTNPHLQ